MLADAIAAKLAATCAVFAATVVLVETMSAALVAMLAVTVALKLALLPNASASSFNVSNAPGAPFTKFATCVSTYDFVEASVASTGAPTLIILLLFMSILSPKPTATPETSVTSLPAPI